jgi:hypothetical protein
MTPHRRQVIAAVMCAGGAVAGYGLARRRRGRWPACAVRAIRAAMEPGSRAESLTLAERRRDGRVTEWTIRPGDAAPVGILEDLC